STCRSSSGRRAIGSRARLRSSRRTTRRRRGVRAETVAEKAAAEFSVYLKSGVPVSRHLADQQLLPFALAGGGAFRTLEPSLHPRTQTDALQTFVGRASPIESGETGFGRSAWYRESTIAD